MSPPEVRLWARLRTRSEGNLAHPVGPYVLDFYGSAAKLAIEVNGSQHTLDDHQIRDINRDQWLADQGIHTYRIPAVQIMTDADEMADGIYRLAFERVAKL